MDKFCKKCGSELKEGTEECSICGTKDDNVKNNNVSNQNTNIENPVFVKETISDNIHYGKYSGGLGRKRLFSAGDTGSIGWGIFGFFVPGVGIILYFLWRKSSPKNAKKCGQGVLANII